MLSKSNYSSGPKGSYPTREIHSPILFMQSKDQPSEKNIDARHLSAIQKWGGKTSDYAKSGKGGGARTKNSWQVQVRGLVRIFTGRVHNFP